MIVDGRIPLDGQHEDGLVRFRFSPRDARVWPYVIESRVPALDGRRGEFTAAMPSLARTGARSARHPRWWTDQPDRAAAEGVHAGARTVNRWRRQFLGDFAERLRRIR